MYVHTVLILYIQFNSHWNGLVNFTSDAILSEKVSCTVFMQNSLSCKIALQFSWSFKKDVKKEVLR